MNDTEAGLVDAVRHPVTGRPCCPQHGPLNHEQAQQPVYFDTTGKWFVLYNSRHAIDEDAWESSDSISGKAFEFRYVCGRGKDRHQVRVYRVMDRKPYPGQAYQLTPGKRPTFYHDRTPAPVPVIAEDVRYPVAEALLRRVWGLQAATDKRRAQRHARKQKQTAERLAALKERRKKAVPAKRGHRK